MKTIESNAEFEKHILNEKLVLVEFYVALCQACQTMHQVLDVLKPRLSSCTKLLSVNLHEFPEAAGTYRIFDVPTLMLFKKGIPIWRQSGIVPAGFLEQVVGQYCG